MPTAARGVYFPNAGVTVLLAVTRTHRHVPNSPTPEGYEDEEDDPDNLSDVDDPEIEAMILGEEEVALRTELWTELNKEYLEQQEGMETVLISLLLPICPAYSLSLLHRQSRRGAEVSSFSLMASISLHRSTLTPACSRDMLGTLQKRKGWKPKTLPTASYSPSESDGRRLDCTMRRARYYLVPAAQQPRPACMYILCTMPYTPSLSVIPCTGAGRHCG